MTGGSIIIARHSHTYYVLPVFTMQYVWSAQARTRDSDYTLEIVFRENLDLRNCGFYTTNSAVLGNFTFYVAHNLVASAVQLPTFGLLTCYSVVIIVR